MSEHDAGDDEAVPETANDARIVHNDDDDDDVAADDDALLVDPVEI